jgi:hypothetical protein
MSLLNSASPYTSSQTIKRTPSIGKRKTQKAKIVEEPKVDDDNDDDGGFWTDIIDHKDSGDSNISESMTSTIELNKQRGKTVNDMLNKITSSSAGEGLVDFKPVSSPALAKNNQQKFENFESPLLKRAAGMPEYVPSDFGMDALSNYNKSYEAGGILGKPYYSINKPSSDDGNGGSNIMQKLNHITHILEDLQMEKTNNITEELILYSFLGVFVIFMVDSFARVGKYHR